MAEMRVASLASGSKGNAYLVEQDGEALLVDCGICFKALSARVESLACAAGRAAPRLRGVLLTHSHCDHTSGLRALLSKNGLPTASEPGDVEWNFTKFLVDREGNVVRRFHPTTAPEEIDAEIAALPGPSAP